MGDLSEHFSRAEFACSCGCGFDTADYQTLQVLESIRRVFRQPVTVTSGCRCPDYNVKVGGALNSQHKLGRAADIVVEGAQPVEVYRFLCERYGSRFGFGLYETFVHVDTRSNGPVRWHG